MRKIATIKNPKSEIKRLMLYETKPEGVYLFGFSKIEDSACDFDYLQDDLETVYEMAEEEYEVKEEDWNEINDPIEGCQDDWIKPVRVKGRNIEKPEWGSFEVLENGVWKEIK